MEVKNLAWNENLSKRCNHFLLPKGIRGLITDFGISSILIVEEMAKDIRGKSDVVCNFYQSAEDVPDPRELSSDKNNLMVFDDLLLE